jgi:hypothetical protein
VPELEQAVATIATRARAARRTEGFIDWHHASAALDVLDPSTRTADLEFHDALITRQRHPTYPNGYTIEELGVR